MIKRRLPPLKLNRKDDISNKRTTKIRQSDERALEPEVDLVEEETADLWGLRISNDWTGDHSGQTQRNQGTLLKNGFGYEGVEMSGVMQLCQSCPELFPKFPKVQGSITTQHTTFFKDTSIGSIKKAEMRAQSKAEWIIRKQCLAERHITMIQVRTSEEINKARLRLERKNRRMERKRIIEYNCASTIQHFMRMAAAKGKVKRIRDQRSFAAVRIQRMYRRVSGCAGDRARFFLHQQEKSATKIQSLFRQKQASKRVQIERKVKVKREMEMEMEKRINASTEIQRVYRGSIARVRVAGLREKKKLREERLQQRMLEKKRKAEEEEALMIAKLQEQRRENLKKAQKGNGKKKKKSKT